MPKIIAFLAITIASLAILIGLARQISYALNAGNRLDKAADEVSNLQEKNRGLKEQLVQAQKYQTVEGIARDKLNLVKPGETIVIIPPKLVDKVLGVKREVEQIKIPNYEGWFMLFFK